MAWGKFYAADGWEMKFSEPVCHDEVCAVLFVWGPFGEFVDECECFPVAAHGWESDRGGAVEGWEECFDSEFFVEFVAVGGVGDDVEHLSALPFADEVVCEEEALGGVDFYDDVADGVAVGEGAVGPVFEDS